MAQDDPQPVDGMSPSRVALLGAYAALNPQLEHELRYVNVRFAQPLNAYTQLQAAAENAAAEYADPQYPPIPRLQLALAAMDVIHGAPRPLELSDPLRPVVQLLVDPTPRFSDVEEPVTAALESAAALPRKERWAQVNQQVGPLLLRELADTSQAWCERELRSVGNEVVSRVKTTHVVRNPKTLDQIARAILPQNWKHCNNFFCELTPRSDRDLYCPGATGGDLATGTTHWRGVYEERVGTCPVGWFPDTFLIFTWDLSEHQLILRYELQPRRANDRTVLKIDEGYIQIDRLPDRYEVTTLKYLLFDDNFIPGGGQTLGQSACALGWLDYAISWFTACADTIPSTFTVAAETPPEPQTQAGIDVGLQQVLDRCETNLWETAADTQAQLDKAMNKLRCGTYSMDDLVGDVGQVAVRGIRDGSRTLQRQLEYALGTLEIVRILTGQKDGSP
ncbi:MAG TPA: hypothetical protein VJT72_23800 [Pseudonocardiaceae bacterium]|nr:hypothetical protein [Pseudonocardiaceae bacterium]